MAKKPQEVFRFDPKTNATRGNPRSLKNRIEQRRSMQELVDTSKIPIVGRIISKKDAAEATQRVKTIDAITAAEKRKKRKKKRERTKDR